MEIQESEQVFTAEIDRISSSGNGIVVVNGNHMNIGPITRDAVGKQATIKKLNGGFGVCLHKSMRADNYVRKHPSDISDKDLTNLPENYPIKIRDAGKGWKYIEPGEEYTTHIHHTSRAGDGIIRITEEDGNERSVNIGPVVQDAAGEKVTVKKLDNQFAVCLTESVKAENYIQNHPKNREAPNDTSAATEDTAPTSSGSEPQTTPGTESTDNDIPAQPSAKTSQQSTLPEQQTDSQKTDQKGEQEPEDNKPGGSPTSADTANGEKEETPSTLQLRKQAEAAATKEVPQGTTTTQQSKPEYSRSPEIKRYVKARADGACEGCGEPAPFTSTTGEPYLHVHHIHELSKGGSDTPDTVVALCPNCHYRVHHGEDGDDYNDELLEVVQEKE